MHEWQNAGTDVQPGPFVLRHASDLHWMPSLQLWLPVHVTSHAHELPHATPLHDDGPEHATSHGPGPHTTPWQDCLPMQSIAHDAAVWQLMPLRHELSVLHWMSHL